MKKATIWALIYFTVLSAVAFTVAGQDVTTSYGCSATYNETSGKYDVVLTGVSQKKSVDLLVDQIKAKTTSPQQVSCYIVEYSLTDKLYTVSLEEKVEGREGFPTTFSNITDVKDFIKKDLKYALDNL
jgi:hypothetical protein